MIRQRAIVTIALVLIIAVGGGVLVIRDRQAEAMRNEGIISAKLQVGETYPITLDSNPTTGYSWQAEFDEAALELVSQEYTPGESTAIGAGGTETLTFRALTRGITQIRLVYQRPWEGVPDQVVIHRLTVR